MTKFDGTMVSKAASSYLVVSANAGTAAMPAAPTTDAGKAGTSDDAVLRVFVVVVLMAAPQRSVFRVIRYFWGIFYA